MFLVFRIKNRDANHIEQVLSYVTTKLVDKKEKKSD